MRVFMWLLALTSTAQADVGGVWFSPYSVTQHLGYAGQYSDGKSYRYTSEVPEGIVYAKYQNSHPSVSFEYFDAPGRSVAAGVYRDSFGARSIFVARHWQFKYGLGAVVGGLAGPKYPHGVVPIVGPEITFVLSKTKYSLGYLPTFGAAGPSLLVASVSYRIK